MCLPSLTNGSYKSFPKCRGGVSRQLAGIPFNANRYIGIPKATQSLSCMMMNDECLSTLINRRGFYLAINLKGENGGIVNGQLYILVADAKEWFTES